MKNSTAVIQSALVELGTKLDFESEREACIEPENRDYAPVYDVVRWLDISPYSNLEKLRPLFLDSPIWLKRFAGFHLRYLKSRVPRPAVKIRWGTAPIFTHAPGCSNSWWWTMAAPQKKMILTAGA